MTAGLQGRIVRVRIEGFRSLAKIDLELPRLAVLIGSNGAGKSNFIRFFEMVSWMLRSQKLQEFIISHGGGADQFFMGPRETPCIDAEIQMDTDIGSNEYRFCLAHLAAGDTVMVMDEAYRYSAKERDGLADWKVLSGGTKESGLIERDTNTAKTIVHLLKQCSVYQFHDTSLKASIHHRWDVTESARLRSDGGNLAAVLLNLQETERARYNQIIRLIRRVLPTFDEFVLERSPARSSCAGRASTATRPSAPTSLPTALSACFAC